MLFYEDMSLDTVRGYAVELDGEVSLVCGIMYGAPAQAFSTMTKEMTEYPMVIMRLSKMVVEILNNCKMPVVAIADEKHKNSMQFLTRMGFEQVEDRMFQWIQ